MTSVGETLRRERVRRNLDLNQVSEELKISTRFLQAMETGNFDKLPGGVFAKAFVRQYAQLLELDAEELASEVQHLLEPQPASPQATQAPRPNAAPISLPRVLQWESISDKRTWWSEWSSTVTALGLVVVVMLICSAVYAYWQRPRHVISAQQLVLATSPAAVPQQAESQQAAPQQAAPQQATPENPPAAPASTPTPAPNPVATQDSAPAPAPPPVADAARPRGAVHVELAFHSTVWVRAQADGKVVFAATIEPNQSRTIDAESTVVLRLGNAGAVTITLNGKQLDPVGSPGQVRTVQLTSGGFHIVAPPNALDPLDPL